MSLLAEFAQDTLDGFETPPRVASAARAAMSRFRVFKYDGKPYFCKVCRTTCRLVTFLNPNPDALWTMVGRQVFKVSARLFVARRGLTFVSRIVRQVRQVAQAARKASRLRRTRAVQGGVHCVSLY